MRIDLIFLPAVATALTALSVPAIARLAHSLGAIDQPGGRRRHAGATAKLGGLAVFLALSGSLALADALAPDGPGALAQLLGPGWRWIAAGATVALATGIVDDFRRIGVAAKLAGQTVAALCAVAGGCVVTGITNPFGGPALWLGDLSLPLTVGWIVLVTNAINLIDGLDGLAAGVTTIIGLTIACLALLDARPETALLAVTLAGASLGFLVHNWHPARIFLGDSGSLLLGYSLAVLSMQGLQKGPTATLILAPVLALGLPLFDTAAAIVRRALASGLRGILQADAGHVHHQLLDRGLSHRRAVLALYAACAGFGLAAVMVRSLRGPGQAGIVLGLAVAVFLASRELGRRGSNRNPGPPPRWDEDRAEPGTKGKLAEAP